MVNKEEGVTIFLTNKRAELFKWFCRYEDRWGKIKEKKIKGGRAVLHFDKDGRWRETEFIEKERYKA